MSLRIREEVWALEVNGELFGSLSLFLHLIPREEGAFDVMMHEKLALQNSALVRRKILRLIQAEGFETYQGIL